MDWDAVAAVGEMVGAVAVVATLLFLILELRESRRLAKSQAVSTLAVGWNSLNTAVFSDPELAAILNNGLTDPTRLSDEEKYRLVLIGQSYINHFMAIKNQYDAGFLPEEEWEFHSTGFSATMNSLGGEYIAAHAAVTPSVAAIFERNKNFRYEPGTSGVPLARRKDQE